MTPPTKRHQNLVDRLVWVLRQLCPDQFEVVREQELRLEEDHRRNPDVLVAKAGATSEDEFSYQPADVLLAIEVVSPGTQTADRKHKPVEYAQAGLPYYWRVESKPLEVHTYRLGDTDVYESTGVFLPGEVVRVPGLEWAKFAVVDLT